MGGPRSRSKFVRATYKPGALPKSRRRPRSSPSKPVSLPPEVPAGLVIPDLLAPPKNPGLLLRSQQLAREIVIKDRFREKRPDAPIETIDKQALQVEKDILTATVIEEMRELGRKDYWYFITRIMFPSAWPANYAPSLQGDIAREIQDLKQGENIWFFIFREGRKSYLTNLIHTWWRIVNDPDIRILLCGAREETVKPFARLILQPFLPAAHGFETFQRVYPDFVFKEARGRHLRQAYQFTHPLRRKQLADPTFRATYLGVSGAGWRCDIMDFDDPIERRSVNSPEQSAKALRNMLDLIPLVDTGSRYRNVIGAGTPWIYHDPYSRIIGIEGTPAEQDLSDRLIETGRTTRVMIRHALENPTTACDDCPPRVTAMYPHGKFDLENGVPPDYPVHTRQMILDRYQEYALDPDKGESLFWHQYGVIYRAPKDQKFKEEWVITVPFPYFHAAKKRVLVVDAADKDMQQENVGDYMVALMGEFDDFGRLLLVYGLRSRQWTRAVFIEKIITYFRSSGWWPHTIAKEKHGESSGTFLTDIGRALLTQEKPAHLVPCVRPYLGTGTGYMKKLDWIIGALQGPMERAEVLFGSAFPQDLRDRAKHELVSLGQLRHDDVADAMALFFHTAIRLVVAPTYGPNRDGWASPALDTYGVQPDTPFLQARPLDPLGQAIHNMAEHHGPFEGIPDFVEGAHYDKKKGYTIVIP